MWIQLLLSRIEAYTNLGYFVVSKYCEFANYVNVINYLFDRINHYNFKTNYLFIYSFLIDLHMNNINIKWSYTIYTTNLCVELEGDIKICSKSRISFVRKNYTLQTSHRNSKMRNLWITRADFHGGMYDRDSYLISRFYSTTK